MEQISLETVLIRAGIVFVLVAANAFFVAAEFSLVALRQTRIELLAAAGDRKAKLVLAALKDLYRQLSAAQLGITVASILLGYVAEETIAELLREWVSTLPPAFNFLGRAAVGAVVAVSVVSFLHVVVGEQAPKAWAITTPEAASRWVVPPLMFFAWITSPATNLLNWSANLLIRVLGFESAQHGSQVHSPEEILMIVRQSKKEGGIDQQDVNLIRGVFRFGGKLARDVMTPRTDITGLSVELTVEAAARRIADIGHSRFPVYRESLDDIVGIVHTKDILANLWGAGERKIDTVMRTGPLLVPVTRAIDDLLTDMQQRKLHIAVVIDEYGGTAGLVTMEDLIEEIVGSIYDEYDASLDSADMLGKTDFPGNTEIDDANTTYGFGIKGGDYTTVGGYVLGALGRLPEVGDRVRVESGELEVVTMQGTRVGALRFVRGKPRDDADQAETKDEGGEGDKPGNEDRR